MSDQTKTAQPQQSADKPADKPAEAAAATTKAAAAAVKNATQAAAEATKTAAQSAADAAKTVTQQAADATKTVAQQTADTTKAASQSAANATRSAASTAAEVGTTMMSEFSRMVSEMKLPAMPDMAALMEAQRRNLETLSAANRVALEGAQTVARRHMEILQQTMAELTESMQDLTSTAAPQAKAAKQAEMLKHSYERAVANMKELGDLIQRANGEALGLLNKRFSEAMDELQSIIRQSGKR
jgi:phasin family protein